MLDKAKLKSVLLEGKSYRQAASEMGCSPTTIRYWANKYGLTSKKTYKCSGCGTTNKNDFLKGRYTSCRKCRTLAEKDRYIKRKRIAVEKLGGKCIYCGYRKNYAALDFHHRDPKEKDPSFKTLRHRSLEKYLKEVLDKCDLVCRNCHAEIHHPQLTTEM